MNGHNYYQISIQQASPIEGQAGTGSRNWPFVTLICRVSYVLLDKQTANKELNLDAPDRICCLSGWLASSSGLEITNRIHKTMSTARCTSICVKRFRLLLLTVQTGCLEQFGIITSARLLQNVYPTESSPEFGCKAKRRRLRNSTFWGVSNQNRFTRTYSSWFQPHRFPVLFVSKTLMSIRQLFYTYTHSFLIIATLVVFPNKQTFFNKFHFGQLSNPVMKRGPREIGAVKTATDPICVV